MAGSFYLASDCEMPRADKRETSHPASFIQAARDTTAVGWPSQEMGSKRSGNVMNATRSQSQPTESVIWLRLAINQRICALYRAALGAWRQWLRAAGEFSSRRLALVARDPETSDGGIRAGSYRQAFFLCTRDDAEFQINLCELHYQQFHLANAEERTKTPILDS
jgi:hypothetical protein